MRSENSITQHKVSLTPEYSTPYSALTRDNVVMGVSRYFLERWVPFLGTGPATVVNTLRQLDYRYEGDAITISGEALAREAAMSRRHLYTCLESAWLCVFIRLDSGQRIRTDTGKILQQSNRYYVRMDDPLIPADAEHLLQVLKKLADTPLEAAQQALELEARDIWANDPILPGEHFTQPRAVTAQEVLARAFPTWEPNNPHQKQAFAQAAENLHRHVTLVRSDGRASKVIVPHYFRRRWWKRLGHDLAWSYLLLRGHVYENPEEGIRRDTCWIPSLNTLLDIIGRPREWWRRNVEHAAPQPDGWSLADFFTQIAVQKGRDIKHPQWVARQFKVALDIPIAPEDRARYSDMLQLWGRPHTVGNATVEHTGGGGGMPQWNTPGGGGNATVEHTGEEEVCHTRTQGSATDIHSKSESSEKAQPKQLNQDFTSKHQSTANDHPPVSKMGHGADAATPLIDYLTDQLTTAFERNPQTPLYQAATVQTWLQQAWSEPIRPHTPAWSLSISGQIAPRDLVALILSVWADKTIKHPPRYLSWLVQRWQTLPNTPPVDQWEQWRTLADLPIGEWPEKGRTLWIELTSRDNRALPFGLDSLAVGDDLEQYRIRQATTSNNHSFSRTPMTNVQENSPVEATGLDEYPGGGSLTIRDIWTATLNQLGAQLGRNTYTAWLEGTKAVSYTDGVLTVRARHSRARDLLAKQLHSSIEWTASRLAQVPIKLCYTSDPPLVMATNGDSINHPDQRLE